MTELYKNQYILLKDVYNFYPKNSEIYSLTINSKCLFNYFDYTKNIQSCKHEVTIYYKNFTIKKDILYNKEIYELLRKVGIAHVLIEKHFRIKTIKRNILSYFCCC